MLLWWNQTCVLTYCCWPSIQVFKCTLYHSTIVLQWVAERLLEGSSVFVNKATQETGVNDVPLVTMVIHWQLEEAADLVTVTAMETAVTPGLGVSGDVTETWWHIQKTRTIECIGIALFSVHHYYYLFNGIVVTFFLDHECIILLFLQCARTLWSQGTLTLMSSATVSVCCVTSDGFNERTGHGGTYLVMINYWLHLSMWFSECDDCAKTLINDLQRLDEELARIKTQLDSASISASSRDRLGKLENAITETKVLMR